MRLAVAAAADDAGDLAGRAAAEGAELLVLPEGAVAPGQASDGPWARSVAGLAGAHRLAILAGYPEACVTGRYNAALLVDRNGICLASYRQTHVAAPLRPSQARGSWLTTMPLGGRRLGLLIGYDIEFPEAAMALALAGCDTLVVLGGVSDRGPLPLLPARARDCGCWLAYAGPGACVLDPAGRQVPARQAPDGLVVAELGPPAPPLGDRRVDRRPRLYKALVDGGDDESRPA
jgi:predicted amidohydrolase